MRNLIIGLALLSPFFLSAQTGQKTLGWNKSRPASPPNVCHSNDVAIAERKLQAINAKQQAEWEKNRISVLEDIIVVYHMKDEQEQSRTFRTKSAARTFIADLDHNPNCLSYHMEDRP
jgi:hypothetical protein